MTTYSAIRYDPVQAQPQILSAIDETNLALKQILGFTVGYYGSVIQVTGNSSYAQSLATSYLNSGLVNLADIQPEWGISFNVTYLSLGTNWFSNASYSQGALNITYDLTGLGISGIAYSASCRLDAQISPSSSNNQICLTVIQDENEPVVGLGMSNFKFYLYQYSNSTWGMVNPPDEPLSCSNGTYIIDVPSGINPQSVAIQVQDTRGITVAASSFDHYTASLTFNSSTVNGGDYVNQYNSSVDSIPDIGTHGNFTAQQQGPDASYDTITDAASGMVPQPSYPTYWNPMGATTCVSGDTSKLALEDGIFMTLGSYGSTPSGMTLYAHQEVSPLGSSYYYLKLASAEQSGTTLQASAGSKGRQLIGKFDYPLTGITSIPASSGNILYRVKRDANVVGYCDADIVIRQSSGSLRTTLASTTAASGNIGASWSTLSGSYSTSAYTVVSQTDYLEIDCYAEVTTNHNNQNMYLNVDNSSLAQNLQTSITNIGLPSLYTVQGVLTGSSSVSTLNDIVWAIASSTSVNGVTSTCQLFNWGTGLYANSGNGSMSATIGTSESLNTLTLSTNPSSYINSSGYWKLMVTATLSTNMPFNFNLDLVKFSPDIPNYTLDLEEQWTNVNTTYLNLHPVLCIDTGASAPAGLAVDAWYGGAWQPVLNSLGSGWNNISISAYLTSPNFTLRFRAGNTVVQNGWKIYSALLRPESDQELFLALQNPSATVAVELLQNGTMRWLGQNLQLTSQTIPVPPVPVKAIHINETIDGVNQQVPFQIEDWASSYTVALGLTSNNTVFGNRQMVVFLVNTHTSDFTLWWNGSDSAQQTPLAYTSTYFANDNPNSNSMISNGNLNLQFSGSFTVTSTVVGTNTSSTSNFMRINNQLSSYGSGIAYVVYKGVVRDIVQQEAEWSNGVSNCPNLYANMVLTLPANATYFTYQLSLMFMNSTQTRTITDLCPISLTTTIGQPQTENGTINGDPVVANGTQTLSNSSGVSAHHWSQFTDGTKGAGIMFTDQANNMLYTFDTMPPATARGALKADSTAQTISLLPVTLSPVSFENALDVTWYGAVATFDSANVPIYGGYAQPGLWILAELPPTITLTVGN